MKSLGFPCGSAVKRIHWQCRRPGFNPWDGKISWRREGLPTPVFWLENSMDCIVHGVAESDTTERLSLSPILWEIRKKNPYLAKIIKGSLLSPWGFPGGSDGKQSACNVRDPGLIPGSGISPREGNGNTLQYSCLESSTDKGDSPWALKESDTTERLTLSLFSFHSHHARDTTSQFLTREI